MNEKIRLAYNFKLKKPGCVIIQSLLGGSPTALNQFFSSEDWDVGNLSDMQLIEGTEEEWRRASEITALNRKTQK
jgi:hypothetical protein